MIPTTTRAAWAADTWDTIEEFERDAENGDAPGLTLIWDPATGGWYLDEGECEGPFAGDDDA